MNESEVEILDSKRAKLYDVRSKRRLQVLLIFLTLIILLVSGWSFAFGLIFIQQPSEIHQGIPITVVASILLCLAILLIIMIIRINKKIKRLKENQTQL